MRIRLINNYIYLNCSTSPETVVHILLFCPYFVCNVNLILSRHLKFYDDFNCQPVHVFIAYERTVNLVFLAGRSQILRLFVDQSDISHVKRPPTYFSDTPALINTMSDRVRNNQIKVKNNNKILAVVRCQHDTF